MAKTRNEHEVRRIPPLRITNAKLIYKNFAGEARKFNAEGLRNFHVRLEDAQAKALAADGWNIKWHDPRNEDEERWASLKIAVRFDKYPPRVVLRTGENRTLLDEITVGILDWAQLTDVRVLVTASYWEANGKSGYKAYLSRMIVTVDEEDLAFEGIEVTSSSQSPLDDDD